jgi:hypothetical protein
MKRYIYTVLIFTSVFALSCMKDNTNMDVKIIDPIVIDTAGISATSFTTFQLDSFKVKLKVSKPGFTAADLKHEWTVNAFQGYKRIVGTGKDLATKITEAPGNYSLIYTVTDPKTNLKAFFSWTLVVNSPFGSGLLVADTKDGVNSDLNLIMSYDFTPSVADGYLKIYKGMYNDANAQKIDGLVKGIGYMKYNTDRILTVITDKSIIRMDPLSYKFTMRDNQCFILPNETTNPGAIQSVQPINQHEYLINNGKIHNRYGQNATYGYRLLGDGLDYEATKICALQRPASGAAGAVLFDDKNGRFLLTPTMTSNSTPIVVFPAVDNSGTPPAFDPTNMSDKMCLHLEEGQNNRVLAVMKSKTAPQYYVYQVVSAPVNGKMGYSVNNLSGNPEIAQSKYYTCSSSENVLFYATDNNVYATSLAVDGTSSPVLRYTAKNGEKITGMQIHRMQGNMFLPSLADPSDVTKKTSFASANRLLILSTYNDATKEGKIITIPIETLGVGGLVTNNQYINTYGGFGKITAFNNQNQ